MSITTPHSVYPLHRSLGAAFRSGASYVAVVGSRLEGISVVEGRRIQDLLLLIILIVLILA